MHRTKQSQERAQCLNRAPPQRHFSLASGCRWLRCAQLLRKSSHVCSWLDRRRAIHATKCARAARKGNVERTCPVRRDYSCVIRPSCMFRSCLHRMYALQEASPVMLQFLRSQHTQCDMTAPTNDIPHDNPRDCCALVYDEQRATCRVLQHAATVPGSRHRALPTPDCVLPDLRGPRPAISQSCKLSLGHAPPGHTPSVPQA